IAQNCEKINTFGNMNTAPIIKSLSEKVCTARYSRSKKLLYYPQRPDALFCTLSAKMRYRVAACHNTGNSQYEYCSHNQGNHKSASASAGAFLFAYIFSPIRQKGGFR
ncbi:MAG: hypothetical protein KBS45_00565, partial [Clostridiales bacterium]|nr:hypothetical protein [Candidatus Coliplasma caballi]